MNRFAPPISSSARPIAESLPSRKIFAVFLILSLMLPRVSSSAAVLMASRVSSAAYLSRRCMSASTSGRIPEASSQEQINLLHSSKVIQVSTDDKAIGPLSKLESHLWANIGNKELYHRAFSVLLFEKNTGSMLIQKRAAHKVTYPSMWANACCSHPEFNEDENTEPPSQGVIAAAYRRLAQELGIKKEQLLNELHPLTRIKYSARCPGDGSDFGEAEIDYILIGLCKDQIPVAHNPEEVEETRWVSDLRELRRLPRSHHYVFTPWFELLTKDEDCLELWWPTIKKTGDLGRITDMGSIRSFD